MKAMILAAGRGERMRPLTDTCPKPLLQVGREPLIGWHLRRLKEAGFEEVIINLAWLGSQIEEALGNGSHYGLKISYSHEGEQGLETAGGIATALPLLGKKPFLVINGDIITDIDFAHAREQAQFLSEQGVQAYLWLIDNPEHNPNGDFKLQEDGAIFSEGRGESLTFSGIGVYHPALFNKIPRHTHMRLAPVLREAMLKEIVVGEKHEGLWLDVGTEERLIQARMLATQWQKV